MHVLVQFVLYRSSFPIHERKIEIPDLFKIYSETDCAHLPLDGVFSNWINLKSLLKFSICDFNKRYGCISYKTVQKQWTHWAPQLNVQILLHQIEIRRTILWNNLCFEYSIVFIRLNNFEQICLINDAFLADWSVLQVTPWYFFNIDLYLETLIINSTYWLITYIVVSSNNYLEKGVYRIFCHIDDLNLENVHLPPP